jgi:hypothetical protein
MHQQLWGYKVEEKLYVGIREQKRLNTTALDNSVTVISTYRREYKNINVITSAGIM